MKDFEPGPLPLLMSLPGIGRVLARRIVDRLHIGNLEELETAIDEGRLEQLEGFGSRRRASLRGMDLGATCRIDRPSVDLLLKIDAEVRRRTVPVLSHVKDGWTFRAMGATHHDRVVIFFEREGEAHRCTVVTRAGKRVVRGRESEA